MKLTLEIKNEQDLQVILLLAERLNIQYSTISTTEIQLPKLVKTRKIKTSSTSTTARRKNYDAAAAKKILAEMSKRKMFAEIADPIEWQKQMRNEWD